MTELTVIMSTYNENRKELNESINSILNQSFSNFYFFIIDDNPSSNNLKKYLIKKSKSDNRVKLIFNKKNLGPVDSRNKGIKESVTPLISLLDADDISVPNRFKDQFRFMKDNDLDFVFPNGQTIKNGILSTTNIFYNYKIINQELFRYLFSHYYNFSIHSGWMLKRDIYVKLNGYRHIEGAEDFDFILRSLCEGYRLGYQPQVLVYRRLRSNSNTKSNILRQFISTYILQKYVKNNSYNSIIPLTYYNKLEHKYVTNRSSSKYHTFLHLGHQIKSNFNIILFIRLMLNLFSSMDNIRCISKLFLNWILRKKVYRMIIKHRND